MIITISQGWDEGECVRDHVRERDAVIDSCLVLFSELIILAVLSITRRGGTDELGGEGNASHHVRLRLWRTRSGRGYVYGTNRTNTVIVVSLSMHAIPACLTLLFRVQSSPLTRISTLKSNSSRLMDKDWLEVVILLNTAKTNLSNARTLTIVCSFPRVRFRRREHTTRQ